MKCYGRFLFSCIIAIFFFVPFSISINGVFIVNENNTFAEGEKIPKAKAQPKTTQGGDKKDIEESHKFADVDLHTGVIGPLDAIHYLLLGIIRLVAMLIFYEVKIINWTMSETFIDIFNTSGVYEGWVTVRDFLNIFFIFFLLFSAFSTIFQVSKYHIRSTWVMIVVMALLVNFSWPLTRVMIDMSNVTMTHMLNGTSTDSNDMSQSNTLLARLSEESSFLELMIGSEYVKTKGGEVNIHNFQGLTTALMKGVVFGFLFMITIGVVAAMLFIRVISLVIYLIFSSIGFTLAAFPSTRSYSGQWWDGIMKQLFVGPILIFTLILSVKILDSVDEAKVIDSSGGFLGNDTSDVLNFIITTVLIWAGVIAAGKIGGAGASFVTGKANAVANWGKRQTLGRGIAAGTAAGKWAERNMKRETKNLAQRAPIVKNVVAAKRNIGEKWQRGAMIREQKAEQAVASAKGASEHAMIEQARRGAARYKENKVSVEQAKQLAAQGDAAAMLHLQNEKALDTKTYEQFVQNGSSATRDKHVMKKINDDMAKKNAHVVVRNEFRHIDQKAIDDYREQYMRDNNGRQISEGRARMNMRQDIINRRIRSLNAKALSEQSNEFHEDAIAQRVMNGMNGDILDETVKRLNTNQRRAWRRASNHQNLSSRA